MFLRCASPIVVASDSCRRDAEIKLPPTARAEGGCLTGGDGQSFVYRQALIRMISLSPSTIGHTRW